MEDTTFVADRSGWGRGPWDQEPEDRIDFEHAGYACFIKRGTLGVWCGYVGIPKDHPAYGQSWDDEIVGGLEVHGGVTYGNRCQGKICHVPKPGMPEDVWWIGFDCGHGYDIVPYQTHNRLPSIEELAVGIVSAIESLEQAGCSYKPKEYAIEEAKKLADQLRGLHPVNPDQPGAGAAGADMSQDLAPSTVPEDYMSDGPWQQV